MNKTSFKFLSILMSVILLFTTFSSAVLATQSQATADYYVKYGGNGDGRSSTSPAPTVTAAIKTMNADGYDEDDTVNIYLMQDGQISTATMTDGYHNLPSWRDKSTENQPTYTAKIIVQPFDTSYRTYLAESTKYGDVHSRIILGGPTEFKDIAIVTVRYGYNRVVMNANGNDFTWSDSRSDNYYWLSSSGKLENDYGLPISTGYTGIINNDFTINVNGNLHYGSVYIGNNNEDGSGDATYNGNVTYVLNNNGIGAHSQVPGAWVKVTGYQNTIFKKNLNVVVKDVSEIGFTSVGKNTVKVNGGVQCVIAPGETVTHPITDLTCFAEGTKFWTLNPSTKEIMDYFTFTDKSGTYKVAEGKELIATDEEGTQYTSKDGYLTIPDGTYTINEYFPPVAKNYYVINGGTGDGRTKENPAGTVKDAIASVNVDLEQRDTAIINIMQRDDWDMGANEAIVGKTSGTYKHAMTAFTADGSAMTAHKATVIIQSDENADGVNYLTSTDSLGQKGGFQLGGNTIFRNIKLVTTRYNWTQFSFKGYDVTFEEDVSFGQINLGYDQSDTTWDGNVYNCIGPEVFDIAISDGDGKVYSDDINLTFNNDFSGTLNLSSYWYHVGTYNGDINLTVDNANASPKLVWGDGHGSPTSTLNKNLNINVKNAKSFTNVDGKSPVKVNGNIQFINSSGNALTGDVTTFDGVSISGNVWNIINNSGDEDALTFTKTAGTFNVAKGYVAVATNLETGVEVTSENSILNISVAGTYNIDLEKEPEVKDYYVMCGGTGDGRSPETPAGTVAKVINSVNQDKLIKGDTANIYIIQSFTNKSEITVDSDTKYHNITSWRDAYAGEIVPEHSAKIILQPYNTDYVTYFAESTRYSDSNPQILAKGPLTIKDLAIVTVNGSNNKNVISANGNEFAYLHNDPTSGAFNASTNAFFCLSANGALQQDYTPYITIGNSAGGTYFKPVNITIAGERLCGDIYIGAQNSKNKITYKEDVNILFNHDEIGSHATLSEDIVFGDQNIIFEKNLNLKVKKISDMNFKGTDGATITVNGGVQLMTENGITYNKGIETVTNFAEGTKFWILNVSQEDLLTFTETAGSYKVADGYVALARDLDGNLINTSIDGTLTLENGTYNITAVGTDITYVSEGKSINILQNTSLDLGAITPDTQTDNKLFVGWKVSSTGEWAKSGVEYKSGETITAEYLDYADDDFAVVDTQIRTVGKDGLRFVVEKKNDFYNAIPSAYEFGTIVLPTDDTRGRDIFIDEAVVFEWQWDEETKQIFTPKLTGDTPITVVNQHLFEETDESVKYTLCITDIEENEYNRYYLVRGYIRYVDNNGIERVAYTDHANTSIYKVAAEATAAGERNAKYDEIIEYVEVTAKEAYLAANYDNRTLLTGYEGLTDSNPNHAMYKLANGIKVREINIDSGKNLKEKIEIAAFSDSHLGHMNLKDIEEGDTNVLSTYRGRGWILDGITSDYTNKVLEYTSMFDKTVLIGDLFDFYSWGSMYAMKRIIADKSVNNNMMFAVGNHEVTELVVPDISGLSQRYTYEEKYERIQQFWPNNIYYHSEILKNDSGVESAMIVAMEDLSYEFRGDLQAVPLARDIQIAREKGIPMLIFAHHQLSTKNPDEIDMKFTTNNDAFVPTGNGDTATLASFYDTGVGSSEHCGEDTMKVYNLIVQNPDVIKGVFHAHQHWNMYTEIMAQDENGNFITDENGDYIRIPQHGVHATLNDTRGFNGSVLKITIN